MGLMSPANETPPIPGSKASGVSVVRVLRAVNSSGNVLAGLVTFDVNYTGFPDPTTFTGFHIHSGPAGVPGTVTINTGIGSGAASVPAGSGGAGSLHYDGSQLKATSASVSADGATMTSLQGGVVSLGGSGSTCKPLARVGDLAGTWIKPSPFAPTILVGVVTTGSSRVLACG